MHPDELEAEPVDGRFAGWPATPHRVGDIAGASLTLADLAPPMMTLRRSALEHNLTAMDDFCRVHDVEIAPHVKTHLAPELARRQLEHGAWALTVADVHQALLFRRLGRLLVANPVIEPADVRRLAEEAAGTITLVDSHDAVSALARTGGSVLIEMGIPRRRAGVRSVDEALRLADAAQRAGLTVVGVEAFEGVAEDDAEIEDLFDRMEAVADRLDDPLVSAGGSIAFDRVARRFAGRRVLIRSGCYLTHDAGWYAERSPLDLRAAIEVWGTVLSTPEPGRAIVGAGRRHLPSDSGLPVPVRRSRDGVVAPWAGAEVSRLNDQHAWLELAPDADLRVGDRVGFGISHPCLAFQLWRLIAEIDDDDRVVGAIRTLF